MDKVSFITMWHSLLDHAARHALLVALALAAALAVGLPLGTAAASIPRARGALVGLAAVGRTVPSIALLMLLLPFLGVGMRSAIVALAVLAVPPVVINVDLGLRSTPAAIADAATGLGMSAFDRFVRVRVPLAIPAALAGVRTAAVELIASATLATFIGAGGLGDDVVRGLQTNDSTLLAASACCVAAMAFAAEFLISAAARRFEVRA